MGYAQWVEVRVTNSFRDRSIRLKDAKVYWGKFYKDGNKDHEIKADEVNRIVIPAGATSQVQSCGRSSSPSGTEGIIDLYDDDIKICNIYWSCPWGRYTNDFQVRDRAGGYMVSLGSWNQISGALGAVDVEVALRG